MAAQEEDNDSDSDYLSSFMKQSLEDESPQQQQQEEQEQKHHLPSIDSTLLIRQLPSQGLSFQIWPAANTLVTLLEKPQQQSTNSPLSPVFGRFIHSPLRILELGSGTGLVGIAAAAILGAQVTITDLPHVLPNLAFNATVNSTAITSKGGAVDVKNLRWGESEDVESIGRNFDIVLGSDVVYHDHLYDPLLRTLQLLLLDGDGDITFVMAHLRRWKKESAFFKKARKMFQVDTLYSDAPAPGARIGVVVYSFARKPSK